MPTQSLEDKIQQAGNPAQMLRNAPVGAYPFPIRSEYTNWRDEQVAWKKSAVLMDSSLHMTEFYFKGPDAMRLLSDTGTNSFETFGPNKAKQFLAVNYDGYVIADCILMGLADDEFSLVGRATVPNWVAFHAETGGYDVEITRDYQFSLNNPNRLVYRYQIQGPNSLEIVAKAQGGPLEEIKFFNVGELTIAGRKLRALSHTMSRTSGFELIGPSADGPAVLEALQKAGEEYGLHMLGGRAYPSMTIESGWLPSPVPAIYTGEKMKPYREWLGADSWEASASLGGSFVSDDIEDYYLTPWNVGLDRVVKFDHDFIGREALEAKADGPHRRKVWLRWNDDDATRIQASSMLDPDDKRAKYMDLPVANYATLPFDKVLADGQMVGMSTVTGYSANVRGWSSLAVIDEDQARDGAEVIVVWGEENGGTSKPTVERHAQTEVRATVSTTPLV